MPNIIARRIVDNNGKPLGKNYWFWCPGCEEAHRYQSMTDGTGPSWNFNGNMDKPSFSPSLLNTKPRSDPKYRCHLFVTDGKIHFCGDCSHHLSGKISDIPKPPDWLQEP